MKVLHINSNYDRTTLHQAMMNELDKLNENQVFVPTYDKACGVLEVGKNVVVSECFRKYDRFFFYYKQKKIIREAERLFSMEQFSLIHGYTLFTDGNVAYELHKKYGIPYVVAVRSTDVKAFFKYRPHLRGRGVKILRNAAAVFFLSAPYRDEVLERFVPQKYREEILKKVHIIPNGIDPYWFTRGQVHKRPRGKELRLVFAGSITQRKNIPTAARSCDELRKRGYDATLTVIGKVLDPAIAQKLSELPYVKMLPPMTKEQLADAYLQQDVFLMPSRRETFGLVYSEAMSQGLPVIYSKGEGFDGQFPEGVVGYGVRCDDVIGIADRIENILEEYEAMSMRCVEKSRVFRWEAFAADYYDIYKEFAE